jgi:hypothetical protein
MPPAACTRHAVAERARQQGADGQEQAGHARRGQSRDDALRPDGDQHAETCQQYEARGDQSESPRSGRIPGTAVPLGIRRDLLDDVVVLGLRPGQVPRHQKEHVAVADALMRQRRICLQRSAVAAAQHPAARWSGALDLRTDLARAA